MGVSRIINGIVRAAVAEEHVEWNEVGLASGDAFLLPVIVDVREHSVLGIGVVRESPVVVVVQLAHYGFGTMGEAVQGQIHGAFVVAEHHAHEFLVVRLVFARAVFDGVAVAPETSLAHEAALIHLAGRMVVYPHFVDGAGIHLGGEAELVHHCNVVIGECFAVDVDVGLTCLRIGIEVAFVEQFRSHVLAVGAVCRACGVAEHPRGIVHLHDLDVHRTVGDFLPVGGIFFHLLPRVVPVLYFVNALAVVIRVLDNYRDLHLHGADFRFRHAVFRETGNLEPAYLRGVVEVLIPWAYAPENDCRLCRAESYRFEGLV